MSQSADARQTTAPIQAVQRSRAAAVASTLALILLCLLWELWLAPLRTGGSLWALKALPLALPLPGLLKNRMYTYRWLSLLLWLYVCEGLMRSTTEHGIARGLAVAEIALSLAIFAACVWHIRLRLRASQTPAQSGHISASPEQQPTSCPHS